MAYIAVDELLEAKWNEYMGTKMAGWDAWDMERDLRKTSFSPETILDMLCMIDVMRDDRWDRMRAGWAADFLLAAAYDIEYGPLDERKDDYENSNGFFPYIPYSTWDFVKYVKRVYHKCGTHNMRFVDIGGGIGDKALIAKVLMKFKYATSLEYNTDTHKIAKETIGSGYGICTKRGDALKYNFGETSRPIFAYMYCPINKTDMLTQLYDRVASTMPEGSVMYDIAQHVGYGDPFAKWAHEVSGIENHGSEHVALCKVNNKPILMEV